MDLEPVDAIDCETYHRSPCFNGCGREATDLCKHCGYATYCSQECLEADAAHDYEHTVAGWLPDPEPEDTLETLQWKVLQKRKEIPPEAVGGDLPLDLEPIERHARGSHHRGHSRSGGGGKWIQKIHMKKGAERGFLHRTHQTEGEAMRNPRTSATNRRRIVLARTLRRLSKHKKGRK